LVKLVHHQVAARTEARRDRDVGHIDETITADCDSPVVTGTYEGRVYPTLAPIHRALDSGGGVAIFDLSALSYVAPHGWLEIAPNHIDLVTPTDEMFAIDRHLLLVWGANAWAIQRTACGEP
jgi:hypothetical protein